ncbi:MAG: HlyD family efflux transporter periplasmic adaptor subunit [Alistipes sp.]|nr:HlyD family efflux transporter periplasmic adaptor subunit [Alistipes sp.]
MDRILPKKKGLKRKHIPYIVVGAAIVGAIGWMVLGNHASKMRVEESRITVSEVVDGQFNEYVRVSGQVQPINTIHLTALESGMVAERLVEEGSMVSRGEVIVRLSNPQLRGQILSSETRLAEQENIQLNTQMTMEQTRLQLEQNRLQLNLDVERKKRKYEQYQKLHDERLTSREEYLQAREDYELAVKDRDLVMGKQYQDSLIRVGQLSQMGENIVNIRENAAIERQRMEDLDVKSPVDGQLGLLEAEIGQWVNSGTRIGQISVLSDFKVEALIDEYYLDRIDPGLAATFERQDRNYALEVRRVYPEVREKQFQTDFIFAGERPDNIRAGQTYYINLQLGQSAEAILIPRGAFYQTTGGKWIFVVSADGRRATRREITIGRQNPQFYEVTSGLEPGERVITSSYDTYGDVQELILQ